MEDISLDDLLNAVSTLTPTPRKRTWAEVNVGEIKVQIACLNCGTIHHTSMRARKDWFKPIYYQNTYLCPSCPEESKETWLAKHFTT